MAMEGGDDLRGIAVAEFCMRGRGAAPIMLAYVCLFAVRVAFVAEMPVGALQLGAFVSILPLLVGRVHATRIFVADGEKRIA